MLATWVCGARGRRGPNQTSCAAAGATKDDISATSATARETARQRLTLPPGRRAGRRGLRDNCIEAFAKAFAMRRVDGIIAIEVNFVLTAYHRNATGK
jgi:hypothetical protein